MKFNDYFTQVPRLETKRFVLRAFTRADMKQYFDILRDDNVQKYLGGGVPIFDKEPHMTNWLNNINGRLLRSKKYLHGVLKKKVLVRLLEGLI